MGNKRKIFIPFIEGILNYNCRECGYSCCQNGLIMMNAKEKKILLQKYPYLRYFFVKETKKTYCLTKYRRCWFLENNGLCYIQKKYGYPSKPFICRLHPFYIARCNDEYVVLPNECPTLYVDRRNKNKNALHQRIFKNAQESIDNDYISEEIPWLKKKLNLEKRILQGSKIFLNSSNYLDFSAYQISITTNNKNIAAIKSELIERLKLWKSFLNIDDLDIDDKVLTYELTAITSLLRMGSIELRQMKEDKVPLVLLGLYLYMLLFHKIRKEKTCLETYQQILRGIPLTLVHLEKGDLDIKNRSLEAKLNYLRTLQKAYRHKLSLKIKKGKGNAG